MMIMITNTPACPVITVADVLVLVCLGHFVLGCRAFDVLGKESWVDPYRPPDRQVLNRKAYRKPYRAVIGFAPG